MRNSRFDANLNKIVKFVYNLTIFHGISFTFQIIILVVTPFRTDAPFVNSDTWYSDRAFCLVVPSRGLFAKMVGYALYRAAPRAWYTTNPIISIILSGHTVRPHHQTKRMIEASLSISEASALGGGGEKTKRFSWVSLFSLNSLFFLSRKKTKKSKKLD